MGKREDALFKRAHLINTKDVRLNPLESLEKSRTWRRFRRHKLALVGATFLLALIFIAIFAPIISPYDPYAIDLSAYRTPPSYAHWLGTDTAGRDVLTRLIYASRVSLLVGLGAVSIYVTIGTILGAISGYYGGWIDHIIMRIADAVLCFPLFVIILVAVTIVGPSLSNIILALGVLWWPGISRIVRGEFLSLREREFVEAAKATGEHNRAIIFRYILPNVVGPIVVAATFGMAQAILAEAGLSFLGLGVQPPTPSWGNMLTDAQSLTILSSMPWLWIPPGAMILITVLSINFVGDGLRDALDVRGRAD